MLKIPQSGSQGFATIILNSFELTSEKSKYINNVFSIFSDIGNKLSIYQKLGKLTSKSNKFKFRLLNHFIHIIVDYFDSDDYENVNFFTTSEIEDVMRHINNITGSNYWLNL